MYHYIRKFDKNWPYFIFLHISDFKKQIGFFEKKRGGLAKITDSIDEIYKKNKFILTII